MYPSVPAAGLPCEGDLSQHFSSEYGDPLGVGVDACPLEGKAEGPGVPGQPRLDSKFLSGIHSETMPLN